MNDLAADNRFLSPRFFAVISIVLISVFSWHLYQSHVRENQLLAHINELELRLTLLEKKLEESNHTIRVLQEESVPGVLKRANSALLDTWQDLLDKMNEALDEPDEEVDGDSENNQGVEILKRT